MGRSVAQQYGGDRGGVRAGYGWGRGNCAAWKQLTSDAKAVMPLTSDWGNLANAREYACAKASRKNLSCGMGWDGAEKDE